MGGSAVDQRPSSEYAGISPRRDSGPPGEAGSPGASLVASPDQKAREFVGPHRGEILARLEMARR